MGKTKEEKIPDILLYGQTEEGREASRERCMQCQYRGYGEALCDYMGVTGKPRILVSPGVGEECKAFLPLEGKAPRKQAAMTVRMNAGERPEDQDFLRRQRQYRQMRMMYDEGMGDRQIAAEMGCSPCTVRNWRLREGLAGNTGRQRTSPEAVQERRRQMMTLWKQGLDDRQISDRMQLNVKTVRKWRRERGLESNWKKVTKHADE